MNRIDKKLIGKIYLIITIIGSFQNEWTKSNNRPS